MPPNPGLTALQTSDFAMWFYANSCWSDGGPIISVKFKPFHAGSASLCCASWFWDVQNMNNSWSAFQCTCAAWWERIVESRLQFIDLRVQPGKWIWVHAFSPWVVSECTVADAGLLLPPTQKASAKWTHCWGVQFARNCWSKTCI